jgi:single-strand DNA-binding protein
MNLNTVILQGNLVSDPEFVGENGSVARFTIASNSGFGEKREVDYIDCVAFGKQVDIIRQYSGKGRFVTVRGRLRQNRWQTPEGENRSKLEVRLDNFDGFYLGPRGSNADESNVAEPTVTAGAEGGSGEQPLF